MTACKYWQPGFASAIGRRLVLGSADVIAFVPTRDPERAHVFFEHTLGLELVSHDQFALVFDANGVMLRVVDVSSVDDYVPAPFTILGWQESQPRVVSPPGWPRKTGADAGEFFEGSIMEKSTDPWAKWEPCPLEIAVAAIGRVAMDVPQMFEGATVKSARWTDLSFYKSHSLMEVQINWQGKSERAFLLDGPENTWWVSGVTGPLYDISIEESLQLTKENAADYPVSSFTSCARTACHSSSSNLQRKSLRPSTTRRGLRSIGLSSTPMPP